MPPATIPPGLDTNIGKMIDSFERLLTVVEKLVDNALTP